MQITFFPAYSSEFYSKIPMEERVYPCIVTDGWDNPRYKEGTRSAFYLVNTPEGVKVLEMALGAGEQGAVKNLMDMLDITDKIIQMVESE